MSITFQVSSVERARTPLAIPAAEAPLQLQGRPMEAMGASAPFLPSSEHGLLHAVHLAYAEHRPLALSPDAVWLCIAQGFARHVHVNAERLRARFVRHEGQATLRVLRDDFVKGSPDNAWPEAFAAFSEAIAEHLGRQRDLVVCDFSTTGPVERAASEIVLLDAMQHYFRYEMVTRCGIPEITLEGTADDWRSLRRRARALEEYELGWWTTSLGPVLDELVATAEGRVDARFWQTLFKHADGSGGPFVQGWINVLLPYLRMGEDQELERNPSMDRWREGFDAHFGGGAVAAHVPSGLSSAPFVWDHLGTRFPMCLLGGFVGVGQDEGTLVVRPVIGWAVRDAAVPIPRSIALIAGRVASLGDLTLAEIEAMIALIASLGEAAGVPLVCAPAGSFEEAAEAPDAKLSCLVFAIGLRVCAEGSGGVDVADLQAALEAARALPTVLWEAVARSLSADLGEETELHLAAAGGLCGGEITFGADDEAHRLAVMAVSSRHWPCSSLDVSPETHAARVTKAEALGVERGAARYFLGECEGKSR